MTDKNLQFSLYIRINIIVQIIYEVIKDEDEILYEVIKNDHRIHVLTEANLPDLSRYFHEAYCHPGVTKTMGEISLSPLS